MTWEEFSYSKFYQKMWDSANECRHYINGKRLSYRLFPRFEDIVTGFSFSKINGKTKLIVNLKRT